MAEIIFLKEIFTQFILPFLVVFFIGFAILEKTKLFGEGKTQLNALLAFVIGLIFVSAVFPKMVVSNLILFLSVALVIVFVVLLLWGFVFAREGGGMEFNPIMKWSLFAVITIAIIIAVLWATGVSGRVYDFFFNQSWSEAFWTNFFFIVLIGIALGVVLKNAK